MWAAKIIAANVKGRQQRWWLYLTVGAVMMPMKRIRHQLRGWLAGKTKMCLRKNVFNSVSWKNKVNFQKKFIRWNRTLLQRCRSYELKISFRRRSQQTVNSFQSIQIVCFFHAKLHSVETFYMSLDMSCPFRAEQLQHWLKNKRTSKVLVSRCFIW